MYDVAIVGAGFGGLGAALSLAEQGAKVVLLEALRYPGGCAATFSRGGIRYESGATLFSGFAPGEYFHGLIKRHSLHVPHQLLNPVLELRNEQSPLCLPADRPTLVKLLSTHATNPAGIAAFFELQKAIAAPLWKMFQDPNLLPPFKLKSLLQHAGSLHRYWPALRWLGRPLIQCLKSFGLERESRLVSLLNAMSQITVQADVHQADTVFALVSLDFFFRGPAHIEGGVGVLATSIADRVTDLGGQVLYSNKVSSITRDVTHGYTINTRRGPIAARNVVLNVLPQVARRLLGLSLGHDAELDRLASEVEGGWGACMLYGELNDDEGLTASSFHLDLSESGDQSPTRGAHIFVSVSGRDEVGRGPQGERIMTASTHVRMSDDTCAVQERMRQTLALRAPELHQRLKHSMTASPRTFERFVGRPQGFVGGVPRTAGAFRLSTINGCEPLPGVFLVGDSVFPGQSILASAIGGERVAARIILQRNHAPRR